MDGQNGVDGRDGRDGLDGGDGRDVFVDVVGKDGQNGADGKFGGDGRHGVHGRDGRDGRDGRVIYRQIPGRDGLDGRDGLGGRSGADGRIGKDGKQGRDAVPPAGSRIGTSYSGASEVSPHVGQIKDPKLINFRDFDLLVTPEASAKSPGAACKPKNYDYIKVGSEAGGELASPSQAKIPKPYEFLNKGLDYTKHNDDDALKELDKFLQRLGSNMDKDKKSVDWPKLSDQYSKKEEKDKPDLMKKYVNGLLDKNTKSGRDSPDTDKLKLLDNLINKLVNKPEAEAKQADGKQSSQSGLDKSKLDELDDMIKRLKDELKNWKPVKKPDAIKNSVIENDSSNNKIIIKTTRQLPSRVYTTCSDKESKQFVKKKIVYSYLDDYKPSTRVYEVMANGEKVANDANVPHTYDLFNSTNSLNYSLKPFDPAIADSFGKPSVDQINKYLSVVNTGVKNSDLIQIHPLLNSQTQIKNQSSGEEDESKSKSLTLSLDV